MMLVSNSVICARSVLILLLAWASTRINATWFTVNGDASHNFSFCRWLGFHHTPDYIAYLVRAKLAGYDINKQTGEKQLEIYNDQWVDLLKSSQLTAAVRETRNDESLEAKDLFKWDKKRFDLFGAMNEGLQREGKDKNDVPYRFAYYVIRIGAYDDDESYKNISFQVKKKTGIVAPPTVPGFSSKQRSFTRSVRPMIADIIIDNEDLYNDLMDTNPKKVPTNDNTQAKVPSADTKDTQEPNTMNTENVQEPISIGSYVAMPTPSPRKRSRPAKKKGEFWLVEAAVREATGCDVDVKSDEAAPFVDMLLSQGVKLKQQTGDNKLILSYKDSGNCLLKSYVQIPTVTTDASFAKKSASIDAAIEIMGRKDSTFKSAKRTAKHLYKHYGEAFKAAMKDLKLSPPEKMGAVPIAAMFKAGNITSKKSRRGIMRHLRYHFGKEYFDPEYKVQMLCEGHTKIMTKSIEYSYEDGKAKETIEFSQKNIADEFASQLKRQLQSRKIMPSEIERIDIITGADHGLGAMIVGSRIVVILKDNVSDDTKESFSFEISVAEILCRKDNADLLDKTVKTELTKGLRTIAKNKLVISHKDSTIDCGFESSGDDSEVSMSTGMYIVGNLALYGMLLGKEGMSGNWCHICKLSKKEFSDLVRNGDPWAYDEMESLANWYKEKVKMKPSTDPKLGMKDVPWFTFIPLNHFVVPLLHCLIGIGDNVLSKFRDIISEHIEYISPEELDTRKSAAEMDAKIEDLKAERVNWDDNTDDGTSYKKLKNKLTRTNTSLKKLGAVGSVNGASSLAADAPIQEFLNEVMRFIEDDDGPSDNTQDQEDEDEESEEEDGDQDGNGDTIEESEEGIEVTLDQARAPLTAVQKRIAEVRKIRKETEKALKPLQKKRNKITNKLAKARAYLKTIKEKIKKFKSERKKADDGIETQMFTILKNVYGVKLQAYHGGCLTGKDIQKVMSNASEIFAIFANILKENAKDNCTMTTTEIDAMCKQFSDVCVLWDGAFSYASKVDPTANDIAQYRRFVKAAVYSHVGIGCSVTPKVHMMWKHVADQMLLPGGLGKKREDWVEHHHQITNRERVQFRTTKNSDVRASARENMRQQSSNPDVESYEMKVDHDACRGPRKNYTSKEDERRAKRQETRTAVLQEWEAANATLMAAA